MNKFILFILGLAHIACNEITYKEPQPNGIKSLVEVPAGLHGMYRFQEENGDTVVIFKNGFRANNKKEEDILYLSDSLVLKKYRDYYFVSLRDKAEWNLRILSLQKNGDLLLIMMENVPEGEAERKVFIENLSKETPVIENTIDSVTHYSISPSPKKLIKLIQRDFFREKKTLVKIN
jgi:hypothetical protein